MDPTPKFEAELVEAHYAIEVPIPLLLWMDFGGFLRINADDERKTKIFDQLAAVPGINVRHIEYNGHFGPYIYFACEPPNAEKVISGVTRVLQRVHAQMTRSKAYRQWCAENKQSAKHNG